MWVHYKTHTSFILCIFFVINEDFVCFKQSVPYTWKKVGILFEGFEIHDTICENSCVLDFKVEPFGGPHIDSLNILILNLPLNWLPSKNLEIIFGQKDGSFSFTIQVHVNIAFGCHRMVAIFFYHRQTMNHK